MNNSSTHSLTETEQNVPPDDPSRHFTLAKPEDKNLKHIALVGDIYTILVSGEETNGQYCLISMQIPPNGGPPPHRHDFEEMFTVSEGEIEFTFRGEKQIVKAGETVNIPANAPHNFTNASRQKARVLCMCSPAGQDDFFLEVGDLVESADSLPPDLSNEEKGERLKKSKELASKYKTEILV